MCFLKIIKQILAGDDGLVVVCFITPGQGIILTSGQDGRVYKCCAFLFPWPHQNYS